MASLLIFVPSCLLRLTDDDLEHSFMQMASCLNAFFGASSHFRILNEFLGGLQNVRLIDTENDLEHSLKINGLNEFLSVF